MHSYRRPSTQIVSHIRLTGHYSKMGLFFYISLWHKEIKSDEHLIKNVKVLYPVTQYMLVKDVAVRIMLSSACFKPFHLFGFLQHN